MCLVREDSGYYTDKFRSGVCMFSAMRINPQVLFMLISISCTRKEKTHMQVKLVTSTPPSCMVYYCTWKCLMGDGCQFFLTTQAWGLVACSQLATSKK